jgi:hypothetical protein
MNEALGKSHLNFEPLTGFKNIHQGRRAFIIGNGPSLTRNDLELLKNEITFASNKIFLYFTTTNFRPAYYAAVDLIFLENFHQTIPKISGTKFLPVPAAQWLQSSNSIFMFREIGHPKDQPFRPRFSTDIREGIFGGYTVSFTLIQLAFYMGIRELYLLGMDHDYHLPGKRTYHHAYGEVLVSEGEVNHFHENYRPRGEVWSMPRPEYQEQSYRLALETFRNHGGSISNATRGGKLEIFPRVNLEEIAA